MKYEFGHVDGLSNLFASKEDMMTSTFKQEVADSLDLESTIYVRCIPEDAAIFGEKFAGGTTWVITHGVIVGDEGSQSQLTGYDKGANAGEILPTDTIQEAIAKLDNRSSSANAGDWLIVN